MTVGKVIRQMREERGWSQAKLGVLSGTGPSGISQIETGRRNPSAATLERIAKALGVEIRDLFPLGQAPLPLGEHGASAQPRARSAAEGHLTVSRTWEDIKENLRSDQLIEILEGVRDGRMTVDTAASQLKALVKEPA
jgi:transcriptional regulator with XRE-family HTH domain